jgi:hypothetical protein
MDECTAPLRHGNVSPPQKALNKLIKTNVHKLSETLE